MMSPKSKAQSPKFLKMASDRSPRPRFTFRDSRITRQGSQPKLIISHAFTLIEVMIALGIFFMAVFTILALVSNLLRNARGLQRPQVDAGLAAAIYMNTNKFTEGEISGNVDESLPDYSYRVATDEFATNGLLKALVVLDRRGGHEAPDTIEILVYDPTFQSTPFSGRR